MKNISQNISSQQIEALMSYSSSLRGARESLRARWANISKLLHVPGYFYILANSSTLLGICSLSIYANYPLDPQVQGARVQLDWQQLLRINFTSTSTPPGDALCLEHSRLGSHELAELRFLRVLEAYPGKDLWTEESELWTSTPRVCTGSAWFRLVPLYQ